MKYQETFNNQLRKIGEEDFKKAYFESSDPDQINGLLTALSILNKDQDIVDQITGKGLKFLSSLAAVMIILPLKSVMAQVKPQTSYKYNIYYVYNVNDQAIIAPDRILPDVEAPEEKTYDLVRVPQSNEEKPIDYSNMQKNQEKFSQVLKKHSKLWVDLKTQEEREKEQKEQELLRNPNQLDEEKLIIDVVNELHLTEAEKQELLLLLSLAIFTYGHYLMLLQKLKGFVALRGGNRRNGNPPNRNESRAEYYRKLKSKRRKIDLLSYIVYIIGYIQYIFQIIVYNFKKILKLLKGNKKALAVILSLFFTLLALKYSKDIAALFPLKNFLINSVKTGGESVIPQHPKLDPGRAEKLRQELREKMPHLFKDGKSRKKDFQEHPYTDSAPKNPVRKGKGKKGKGKK
jgi:hypothetical protein